jgi:hypothetical protein
MWWNDSEKGEQAMGTSSVQIITLDCPNCGGRLEMTVRADLFKCAHCRYLALVRYSTLEAEPPRAVKLVEKKKWAANFSSPTPLVPWNWQGGTLYLTEQELVFAPHSFNFGPLERVSVALKDIVTVTLETGIVSDDVFVVDVRGERWAYRAFKGKALIDAIEEERRALVLSS